MFILYIESMQQSKLQISSQTANTEKIEHE
jgi:hypothetical protein